MKSTMWMLAALVACVASRAQADGVCFDPDHNTGKNAASVAADMATINAKGFSYVRTYISRLGSIDMASIVANAGLRVALGVPYPDSDYQQHVSNAVNAAKIGSVDYIFVGNENIRGSVPAGMADVIRDIKSKVGSGVKVGTVQRVNEYVSNVGGMADLVSACDAVGVNIHPFFNPGTTADTAISVTNNQWKQVINSGLPSIGDKLLLTETGWPSAGSYAGNTGSVDGAQKYFAAYKSWAAFLPDNKKFYFQMFDTPYKSDSYEQSFGLVTYDSQSKFSAGGNPAVVTTPAPTTPTPTTAKVSASLNVTSSTAGSSSSDVVAHVQSSGSVDKDASTITESSTESSKESETKTVAENEAGVVETTGTAASTATTTDSTATNSDGTQTAGGKSDDATDANVKSGTDGGSSIAGVLVIAAFGAAAVGAAFAFIYKARQKAAELDASENKSFDSFAMTPGGGCAL